MDVEQKTTDKKRTIPTNVIIVGIIILIIIIVGVCIAIPEIKKEIEYQKGIEYLEQGDYDNSSHVFMYMPDYRDARALWYYSSAANLMRTYSDRNYIYIKMCMDNEAVSRYRGEFREDMDKLREEIYSKEPYYETTAPKKEPKPVKTKKKSYNTSSYYVESDEYGVRDYDDAEDFYEDYYDDFECFEDAEDYYDDYYE